ncbi:protein Abitram-like [Hydractinia symbiolongicarpus]|uniref:protein Abitram-like n=1 Tax=Hydractinia symbiolongicarpus TaxID=13093 RepID=UPI00254FCAC0|nr:protein Abitram-like [Hydractinia symbiolongicarpus]
MYPSVVDRYFQKFYHVGKANEDLCILAHSNRICLVTLVPDHKALSEGPITSVSYVINGKDLGAENKVHGKKKLDAFKVYPETNICEIVSGAGNKYTIKSGVFGKLCETNVNLLKDTTILDKMPETNGYIAIILHKFGTDICSNLLTEEQYLQSKKQGKTEYDSIIQESVT